LPPKTLPEAGKVRFGSMLSKKSAFRFGRRL
jgi:hypothetical protein